MGRALIAEIGDFTFNSDPSATCDIQGWQDGVHPQVELAASGRGVVPTLVRAKESYYTMVGTLYGPPGASHAEMEALRSQLLRTLPLGVEVPLRVTTDVTRTAWVMLYDKPETVWGGNQLTFTLPIVSPDPSTYGDELVGTMGVFTGQGWFRTYSLSGTRYVRTYTLSGGRRVRTYEQAEPSGALPPAANLVSEGDTSSDRVVAEVTGPLTAGDWWLENETTGARLWADLSLTAGHSLVFDCHTQTARLNGTPVDDLVFGDFLTLEPGLNVYRLVSGQQSDGFATITARPAYR